MENSKKFLVQLFSKSREDFCLRKSNVGAFCKKPPHPQKLLRT
jgi:hypothetical protein